jgi:hypothetical protein
MPFGVMRVINCEILWLDLNGRYREVSELTWRTLDREQAYTRARTASGLCAYVPETQNAPQTRLNGRQRVLTGGGATATPELPRPKLTDDQVLAQARERKKLLDDLRRQVRAVPVAGLRLSTEKPGCGPTPKQ